MKYSKDAIWVGRFQPPSIAHFHTLITILEQWPRATIGVVSNEFDNIDRKGALWDQYRSIMRPTGKNLFSSDEIIALWSQAIKTNDLCNRVNVRSVIRPECSIVFDADFHFSRYDYIEVDGGGRQYEC